MFLRAHLPTVVVVVWWGGVSKWVVIDMTGEKKSDFTNRVEYKCSDV